MDLSCINAIPANPDISGVGVRDAIYIQNLLSFIPAFYALKDKKVSETELKTIEKQATTILITAFAVLISAMVQAGTFGLYSFHTSIILNLSWMNNTNTFIYFLLYIHHKSDPEVKGHVKPKWSSWFTYVFGSHRFSGEKTDFEATLAVPEGDSMRHSMHRLELKPHTARSMKHEHQSGEQTKTSPAVPGTIVPPPLPMMLT
jgi:hypothetical protein